MPIDPRTRYPPTDRPPLEGGVFKIQSVLEREIGALFGRAGVEAVEFASELDETGIALDVAALQSEEPWNSPGALPPSRIYAQDRSLLVVVDWDSFFMLICGTRARLDRAELASEFEGFFCSALTRHHWWQENA